MDTSKFGHISNLRRPLELKVSSPRRFKYYHIFRYTSDKYNKGLNFLILCRRFSILVSKVQKEGLHTPINIIIVVGQEETLDDPSLTYHLKDPKFTCLTALSPRQP